MKPEATAELSMEDRVLLLEKQVQLLVRRFTQLQRSVLGERRALEEQNLEALAEDDEPTQP